MAVGAIRFAGYAVVNRGRGYRLIAVNYPDETVVHQFDGPEV